MQSSLLLTTAEHFSFLLYAFRLDESFDINSHLLLPDNYWRLSTRVPNQDFLFEHVHSFLAGNGSGRQGNLNLDNCVILQPKVALSEEPLYKGIFSKQHTFLIEKGTREISFSLGGVGSDLEPQLVYVPLAKIMLLTFGLKAGGREVLSDEILDCLHHVRIHDSGDVVQIRTRQNVHPQAQANNVRLAEGLKGVSKTNVDKVVDDEHFFWTIPTFIHYLLGPLAARQKMISPPRLQALNFFRTSQKEEDTKLLYDFQFRLSRMYTEAYLPPVDNTGFSRHFRQPFEPIHFSAFAEGASVLVNADRVEHGSFLDLYGKNVVQQRLFWSWILADIQHYSLMASAALVGEKYRSAGIASGEISALLKRLYAIQIKCFFTSVSHHTQQNSFYELCCDALKVKSMFEELKIEISDLNASLEEESRKLEGLASERLNTTIGAIGIGISAAQIAAGMNPNIILELLSHCNEYLIPVSETTFTLYRQTVVLFSNLLLGLIFGIVGKWALAFYFRKRKKV